MTIEKRIYKSDDLRVSIGFDLAKEAPSKSNEDEYCFKVSIEKKYSFLFPFLLWLKKWKCVKSEFIWVKDREELNLQIEKVYQDYVNEKNRCKTYFDKKLELFDTIQKGEQ